MKILGIFHFLACFFGEFLKTWEVLNKKNADRVGLWHFNK
jgi:hypothetical protein